MGRLVQFPRNPASKFGLKKIRKNKIAEKREQLGQLNLFQNKTTETKIINFPRDGRFFERALELDSTNYLEAKEAYEWAIKQNDNKVDSLCNLGVLEYGHGNINLAVDSFTKALQDSPRHLESHFNLANLYSELGNFTLAKLHYETAILIDPSFSDAHYNLGLAHISLKEYSLALNILSKYCLLVGNEDKDANTLIDNLNRMME